MIVDDNLDSDNARPERLAGGKPFSSLKLVANP
jgi:hypothetical protein